VSPSPRSCLRSTPAPRATSSIVALSVSISARMSPSAISSPSPLSQRTTCPSSMVGESASMWTLVAIGCLGSVGVELRTANCELRSANCELRTANCELRTANCELSVEDLVAGVHHALLRGLGQLLEAFCVGHGDVGLADP